MSDDLFDLMNQPAMSDAERKRMRRRLSERPRGYAGIVGNGPKGETCKTCEHYTRKHAAGVYRKCALVAAAWTKSPRTDIKASAPACEKWEAQKPEPLP